MIVGSQASYSTASIESLRQCKQITGTVVIRSRTFNSMNDILRSFFIHPRLSIHPSIYLSIYLSIIESSHINDLSVHPPQTASIIANVAPSGTQILTSLNRGSASWKICSQSERSRSRALKRLSMIMSMALWVEKWY